MLNAGLETVRAWKDPDLGGASDSPVGVIDLEASVGGVMATNGMFTFGCCDLTTGSYLACSDECSLRMCIP